MATSDSERQSPENDNSSQTVPVDDATRNSAEENVASQKDSGDDEGPSSSHRLFIIYTRPEILVLHKSPLVKPPPNMPDLKSWFGLENEQILSRKEPESSSPSATRDRRFRRDPEDGETPTRPTFRSALTQPSQMGNFKHQPTRAGDRDRDRDRDKDVDKDRERDIRDKEGQERLRHLSDKYDRDRLGIPTAANGHRTKERDAAPHLAASSSRVGAQTQVTSLAARRAETREAAKKKLGEVSDDWRRGSEYTRGGREDRSDTGRKDREDRERPRSRVRDSSRTRRDPSIPRRDREERDREVGEVESDDPRRWRDDGKREERIANRRERQVDRDRDRRDRTEGARDSSRERRWPAGDERRWAPLAEDRDGRTKRSSGRDRDRRSGVGADEGKDKEDRREREKEKEPAWMDTYIPGSGPGIMGGAGGDGELDGIQAWKKGMKEKEKKENGGAKEAKPLAKLDAAGHELDEIQIFKLMMKREEEKKKGDPIEQSNGNAADSTSGLKSVQHQDTTSTSIDVTPTQSSYDKDRPPRANISPPPSSSNVDGARSLLSLLTMNSPVEHSNVIRSPITALPPLDPIPTTKTPASRLFPNPLSSDTSSPFQGNERASLDPAANVTQFNPPQGSRLLALGARTPTNAILNSTKQHINNTTSQLPNEFQSQPPMQHIPDTFHNAGLPKAADSPLNSSRSGFTPFKDQSRFPQGFEDLREQGSFANPSDAVRRPSAERSPFAQSPDPAYSEAGNTGVAFESAGGAGHAAGKGSRFAKFFDNKAREGPPMAKSQAPASFVSSSPGPGQRPEPGAFNNGMLGGGADHRTMDDIFAMLSGSTQQGQRGNLVNLANPAPLSGTISYGQGPVNLHSLQQQQLQQQQHMAPISRLDALYESRLDDRNFVPDGMVPGLRTTLPPRSRENNGMFSDTLDDNLHFNGQRLPPPQRGLEQMYGGQVPSMYSQQGGRNVGIPLLQPQYRGGTSPIPNQNPQQQRLPPGLANLGGRPPHEPAQFLGMPGLPSAALHGLHGNGPPQPPFNGFVAGGFAGGPQMRAPPPGHLLQNPLSHNPMAGLGPGNMDLRGQGQAQLLGMGGLRGVGGGFVPQQAPSVQMQAPHLARQQQQQQQQQQPHLPPHMMPHLLPPHLQQQQQQQQGLATNNQPANELMALLMGGARRE